MSSFIFQEGLLCGERTSSILTGTCVNGVWGLDTRKEEEGLGRRAFAVLGGPDRQPASPLLIALMPGIWNEAGWVMGGNSVQVSNKFIAENQSGEG